MLEYLGVWEQLHNPNFNPIEFDGFRNQAGLNGLVVLSNMESLNSELIKQGMPRDVRYEVLHRMAEEQLKVLNDQNAEYRFKKLTSGTEIIND